MTDKLIAAIRAALDPFVFKAASEAAFQDQVSAVLMVTGIRHDLEVRGVAGRYDVLAYADGVRVVLELKLHAAAGPVERQVMRYVKMPEIDAVGVVTTSRRLEHSLGSAASIGGKPFFVIAVRTS